MLRPSIVRIPPTAAKQAHICFGAPVIICKHLKTETRATNMPRTPNEEVVFASVISLIISPISSMISPMPNEYSTHPTKRKPFTFLSVTLPVTYAAAESAATVAAPTMIPKNTSNVVFRPVAECRKDNLSSPRLSVKNKYVRHGITTPAKRYSE